MKKKFLLAATAAVLLAMACGGAAKGGANLPTIGMAVYRFDDTHMSNVRLAVENAAKDKAIISAQDGQNDQAKQNDQIDMFISQAMPAMIINPVDRTSAAVTIDKAKAADIPIVFINREPEVADMNRWNKVYYVGAVASDSGRMGAEIIQEYFAAHPEADKNGDGKIQYVVLMGQPGHQDAIQRTEAVEKFFANSGVQLAKDYANWERAKGQDVMNAFLTTYGDKIEAVLANNDDMALGAIEALKAAGYFTNGKFMPVVGVDATAPALDAMANGTLLGSSLNDAKGQGQVAFEIAYALTNNTDPTNIITVGRLTNQEGQGSGNYVWIPYQKVTQENYQNFRK